MDNKKTITDKCFYTPSRQNVDKNKLNVPQNADATVVPEYKIADRIYQWTVDLREEHCPPSSYHKDIRSSRSLIHLGAGFGSVTIALVRYTEFDKVIAVELEKEYTDCLETNISVYDRVKDVSIANSDYTTWIDSEFSKHEDTPVIIDVQRVCSQDKFSNQTLLEQCQSLLAGPNTKAHSPLIILFYPTTYNFEFTPDTQTDIKKPIMKTFDNFTCVALVADRQSKLQAQRSTQRKDTTIPTVQDLNQWYTVWTTRNSDLKQRIEQFLGGKVYHEFKHVDSKYLSRKLGDYIIHERLNDKQIYQKIHSMLFTASRRQKSTLGESQERSDNRVQEITDMLFQNIRNFAPQSFVDVGCAEGSITAALGKDLKTKVENTHGCDVRNLSAHDGFVFSRISETDGVLPYEDASHPLVVCLMVLHHIPEPQKTLSEIYRILEPGGYLLIREHDCDPENLAMVLDLVHGLYSMSLKDPIEDPSFCETYFARYFSQEECIDMVTRTGFLQTTRPSKQRDEPHARKIRNPQRFYYALFQKPIDGIQDKLKYSEEDDGEPAKKRIKLTE